ncbi:MAG: hypothetical protein AAF447_23125 [Myxococcota bacterium]
MLDDESNLNLNGEFLGVTSMAVYSAPWFLQVPLIVLVGLLFFAKVAQGSKRLRAVMDELSAKEDEDEEVEKLVGEVNRIFLGFTVDRENLPGYWIGAAIYLITAVFAVLQLIAGVAAV